MIISKIQNSISILLALQMAVDECLDITGKERHDKNSKIYALVNSQLLIYANSFMEEWENLDIQCKDDIRVMKVRKIASPLMRKIRQWNDLNAFRNNFLAHCFRDSKGNNVLLKKYDKELNIPTGFGDFILLGGCIFCTKEILLHEFAVEYNEMLPYLKTIKPPGTKKIMLDEDQAKDELDKLVEETASIRAGLL
jgi:hypothetical protein